ncbi:asparagine synthase (glutamine-hydrolyzing) [Actinoplanes teichomyceticus]|uniref:asparagine synthase (glutamine-hydrolyzing) n=1 Tax=Actinoplanes teichomyceticus TaxID=1867 RepID=A0A1B1ESN5_ACTTI|nr:asparagine synthase (glutamine-hydrolyzing) [Actinoplanes teichomyceticus]ANQ31716.1 asparagoine synthetase [Actinoplanes teichomyceticus]TWG14685.1 asparagine synthase (glutamine-hydrolysing) [Actinoplanes teichomyceticus]GIF10088.1 amidotransferase 1, exosortase A system-associated [Actinoplanes teichomyceticus]
MCGIAGWATPDDPDPEVVAAMLAALAHRGPDGEGRHVGAGIALGMRRLAIVDVAGGAQPVFSEDGTVVAVLNGEIYNHGRLRADLLARGHRLASGSDSECLVHLYEEHGDDLVRHLHGMFAFAIWDAPARRLLLGRDRVGKKPLFWRPAAGGVQFASELKAFLADPRFPRAVDPAAVDGFLTCAYVPGPGSIWRDVRRVEPGTVLSWQAGAIRGHRYHTPPLAPVAVAGFDEAAAELRERLTEATRLRLIGERPIGVLLSGGLDSSAVLAAVARQHAGPVPTFTIGFEDAATDERRFARAAARHYGADHHEWVLGPDVVDLLDDLGRQFDEPFADSSAIATFYLARMAARHVTVVLNGDGGDECFGGYDRYGAMVGGSRVTLPGPAGALAVRLGGALARSAGGARLRRAGRLLELAGRPPADRYAALMSVFEPARLARLYTAEFARLVGAADPVRHLREAWAQAAGQSLIDRMLTVDQRTYLAGDLLPKMDLATMAHGVEARSPFLDQDLMAWAARLPAGYKVAGGSGKRLLKHAMRDWLPAELIDRPKAGFGVPMDDWLRGRLRPLAWDLLTDRTARQRGVFRPQQVRRLLAELDDGQRHGRRIWAMVQLESWYRRFADRPPALSVPGTDLGGQRCSP